MRANHVPIIATPLRIALSGDRPTTVLVCDQPYHLTVGRLLLKVLFGTQRLVTDTLCGSVVRHVHRVNQMEGVPPKNFENVKFKDAPDALCTTDPQ